MKICWVPKKVKVKKDIDTEIREWLDKYGYKHKAAWLKAIEWHFTFIAFPRVIKLEDTDKKCFVWLRFVQRKLVQDTWFSDDANDTNFFFFARHPVGRTWLYKL